MPALTNVDVEFVSLVDRAAVRDPVNQSEPNRFLIWKRETNPTSTNSNEGADSMPTIEELTKQLDDVKADLDSATERAEKAEGERDTLNERVEKLEADAEKSEDTEKSKEINKDELPEAVREALEKAEKAEKEATEKAEKAEKVANEEREARLTKEFIAKADAYEALPVEAEKFGPVLKEAAEKLSEESFEALETALKAADKQIAEGDLFKEQGSGGSATPSGALDEATKKADELRKSDSNLSQAEALDRVLSADRSLQERYLAEVRG